MRVITLDFQNIKSEQDLRQAVQTKLEIPPYTTLDELWKMLIKLDNYTLLELKNLDTFYDNLGADAAKFLNLIDEMTQENSYFWLKLLTDR